VDKGSLVNNLLSYSGWFVTGLGGPLAHIPVKIIALRMNDFGLKFLQAIDKKNKATGKTDGCIAVAPIALAGMVAALASASTVDSAGAQELSDVLQLPLSCTECVEELGNAMREIVAAADPRAVLWMPMCVWASAHTSNDYKHFLGECLGIEAKKLMHTQAINLWFEDRSDRKMSNLVPSDVQAQACYLTSGLFFRGQWACGFAPEDNTREVFTITQRGTRQKVQVPCVMMRKRDTLPYVEVWTNETAANNTVTDTQLAMLAPEGIHKHVSCRLVMPTIAKITITTETMLSDLEASEYGVVYEPWLHPLCP
jgi:serine protease inhibitor